jgi:hypothetical protein
MAQTKLIQDNSVVLFSGQSATGTGGFKEIEGGEYILSAVAAGFGGSVLTLAKQLPDDSTFAVPIISLSANGDYQGTIKIARGTRVAGVLTGGTPNTVTAWLSKVGI